MANDSVGVAAAASPTNYIDNEQIATGGSPANVDRQRVRVGGAGYTDLADVVTGDTGQGAQVVTGGRLEVAVSSGANTGLAATDCSNYRTVSVRLSAKATGATVTPQVSNDNSNWAALTVWVADGTSPSSATALTAGPIYTATFNARYFRLNQTGATSGTTTGTVEFFGLPSPPPMQSVVLQNSNVGLQVSTGAPDDSTPSSGGLVAVFPMGYVGSLWERLRIPKIFKTATATASGDTALWTPTSGKKFRLMRFKIEATADAATSSGATIDVVLRDSTTATAAAMSFYAPATSVTTSPGVISSGWIDLGNGILSAAANNVLNINLSAALTSGKVRVVACGTEE